MLCILNLNSSQEFESTLLFQRGLNKKLGNWNSRICCMLPIVVVTWKDFKSVLQLQKTVLWTWASFLIEKYISQESIGYFEKGILVLKQCWRSSNNVKKNKNSHIEVLDYHLRIILELQFLVQWIFIIISGESVRGEADRWHLIHIVFWLSKLDNGALKLLWSLQKLSLGLLLPAGDLVRASVLWF